MEKGPAKARPEKTAFNVLFKQNHQSTSNRPGGRWEAGCQPQQPHPHDAQECGPGRFSLFQKIKFRKKSRLWSDAQTPCWEPVQQLPLSGEQSEWPTPCPRAIQSFSPLPELALQVDQPSLACCAS